MASEKLQKILAMSKNIEKKSSKNRQMPQKTISAPVTLHEQISRANQTIANIDTMYNGPYIPTNEEQQKWNTEKGRKELTEMADQNIFMKKLSQSKLPAAIIESIKNNPCNYDPSYVNKEMGPENELFKKLNEAYGKSKEEPVRGVKAVQQINEQLDARDKEIFNETIQSNTNINGTQEVAFDISMLEQVIERVIDKKINSLNESISKELPSIKTMSFTNNGNFRFLDSEDNVYECQMKYIGKRKKKK